MAMAGIVLMRCWAMLVMAWGGGAADDPPVISLDLSGGAPHGVERWKPLSTRHKDVLNTQAYARHCPVLTSSESTCPEPRATAFDHHEGGGLAVKKVVRLLVKSSPGHEPVHENTVIADVNYNLRGEYLLEYDAMDASGNKAEQVSFAMVVIGRCLSYFSCPCDY
jgi:hypothetical protein